MRYLEAKSPPPLEGEERGGGGIMRREATPIRRLGRREEGHDLPPIPTFPLQGGRGKMAFVQPVAFYGRFALPAISSTISSGVVSSRLTSA